MMDWNFGWGAMMMGGLGMLAFWGLIIALVIWGIRSFTAADSTRNSVHPQGGDMQPTPLEILQARYARGEISREEYEAIRKDLSNS